MLLTKKYSGSLISYFSNKVKQHGGINLAQGLPGFNIPEQLEAELKKSFSQNIHQYAPGYGIDELRQYAANELNSSNITPKNILITNGGTEAISLLYLYLYKQHNKDLRVLSISPVYESYSQLPKIYNNQFVEFFTEPDFSINLKKLESSIIKNKINLFFLASPGNPLGKIYDKDIIINILEICKANNVSIVFDIVYKHLFKDKPVFYPFEALSNKVFFADSFSKQFSITGWRLGYLAAHESIISDIAAIHDYTGLSAPHPLQIALSNFLTKYPTIAMKYKHDLQEEIMSNMNLAEQRLTKAGYTCYNADGGFFVWAKIPKPETDGFHFAETLYKKSKVAIIPGEHFGRHWKNFIRINIAHPEDLLNKALELIVKS
jgi:aminotransferase